MINSSITNTHLLGKNYCINVDALLSFKFIVLYVNNAKGNLYS